MFKGHSPRIAWREHLQALPPYLKRKTMVPYRFSLNVSWWCQRRVWFTIKGMVNLGFYPQCSHDCTSFGLKYDLNTKIVTSSMSNLLFFLWHLPLGINQWIGLYQSCVDSHGMGWMTIPHSSHVYYSHIISLIINPHYLHYNPCNCGWLM